MERYLHLFAEGLRWTLGEAWANQAHALADAVQTLGGVDGVFNAARTLRGPLPTEAECVYCDEGKMRVVGQVCQTSEEGKMGYRTRWKCNKCGKGDIR